MILQNTDLMAYYKCSKNTATKRRKEISQYFPNNPKVLNVYHLAEYEGLEVKEILDIMFYRPKIYPTNKCA